MKPESRQPNSATGAPADELFEPDTYLITIVNECQDASGIGRSENITVVVDELDSTALRRRTSLLRSAGRGA